MSKCCMHNIFLYICVLCICLCLCSFIHQIDPVNIGCHELEELQNPSTQFKVKRLHLTNYNCFSCYLRSCSTNSSDKSKRPTFWGAGRTSHKDVHGPDRADLDPNWRSSNSKKGTKSVKEESNATTSTVTATAATANATVRFVNILE